MKRKLLLAAVTFLAAMFGGGGETLNAQVMIETDLTTSFNSLATTQWEGSSGQVGWAAPQVTTNSGLTVAAWESYCGDWNGGCTNTGIIMKTTVKGLTAGTYKIELYGAAAFTFNRNFGSDAFTGNHEIGGASTNPDWNAGDCVESETGVTLYATTFKGTYSQEIPIWYADNFNGSGLSTVVLNGVVVGDDGEIEIGMSKTSQSTNWHVVQLKGVTATVDAVAALTNMRTTANNLLNNETYVNVTGEERVNLQTAYEAEPAEETGNAYKAVIENLASAISAFENSDLATYNKLGAEKSKAIALGMDATIVNGSTYIATSVSDVSSKIQALKVAEYDFVTTNYAYGVELGEWKAEGPTGSLDSQHWSGQVKPYMEQSGEAWNSDSWYISYSQDIKLPAGNYVFKVAGRRNPGNAVTMKLIVKNGETELGLVDDFPEGGTGRGIAMDGSTKFDGSDDLFANNGNGWGFEWRYVKFTLDEDVVVNVAVVAEATDYHQWVSFCDATIQSDNEAVAALLEYNEALQAAKAIAEKTIPTTNYTTLQGLINNPLPDGSTAAQYEAATETLNKAVTAATAIQVPYATWKQLVANAKIVAPQDQHPAVYNAIETIENYVENNLIDAATLEKFNMLGAKLTKNYSEWLELLAHAVALQKVSNNNADANESLAGVIATQRGNISNSSIGSLDDARVLTEETIPNAINALKAAMITYIQDAEPTNDECFDLTFMIENPHFTKGEGGNKVATGWTLAEGGAITEHRIATHNFEAWHAQFNLSQTIPDLPKGTYKVTLQGFARHDHSASIDQTKLYCGIVDQEIKNIKAEYSETPYYQNGDVQMGDENYDSSYQLDEKTVYQPNGMTGAYYWFQQTNPLTGKPFYTNEVQTLVPEAGDLTIGFKCESLSDWVIWDNFHLYYYGSAIAVTIDENETKSFSDDIENAKVTLKRTIKEGMNTLVLPFSMTNEEVEANFGKGSLVYKVKSYANSSITFEKRNGIAANDPCILDAKKAGTSYQLENRTIVAAEPSVTVNGLSFIGSYAASIKILPNENNYILYNGKLYLVDSDDVTLKGTRAYFNVEGANAAREIAVTFDGGEATGIAEIDGEKVATGVMYNLAGQVVGDDYKGIVIIDGKKVLK